MRRNNGSQLVKLLRKYVLSLSHAGGCRNSDRWLFPLQRPVCCSKLLQPEGADDCAYIASSCALICSAHPFLSFSISGLVLIDQLRTLISSYPSFYLPNSSIRTTRPANLHPSLSVSILAHINVDLGLQDLMRRGGGPHWRCRRGILC